MPPRSWRARRARTRRRHWSRPRKALRDATTKIILANRTDMERGAANGLTSAMLDRLRLDDARIAGIADAVEQVASLPDPVGAIIDEAVRPNGMKLQRVRVPLGVIGIIYESRPNVDGGRRRARPALGQCRDPARRFWSAMSNRAIHAAMVAGIAEAGLPADAVQLVPEHRPRTGGRDAARYRGSIDIIVPRGGKCLVARVQEEARVPVLAHLDGICHTYVARRRRSGHGREIVLNAKMRRTGICGAMETLLIDKRLRTHPEALVSALLDARLRGARRCARSRQWIDRVGACAVEPTGTPNISTASSRPASWTAWTRRSPISPRMAAITPTRSSPGMPRPPSIS